MMEVVRPGTRAHRILTVVGTIWILAILVGVVVKHLPAAWIAAYALYGTYGAARFFSEWNGPRRSPAWRRAEMIVVAATVVLTVIGFFTYRS